MFGLASETIVKREWLFSMALFLGDYCQNFTIMHAVLFPLQHWQRLAKHGPDRPEPRCDHAATSFTLSQLGNLLLVVGGVESKGSWIIDVRTKRSKRVSVANNWVMTHALTHNTH